MTNTFDEFQAPDTKGSTTVSRRAIAIKDKV